MSSSTAAASPKATKSHSRKKSTGTPSASSTTAIAKRDGVGAASASKLPSWLRFPLVVVLNLSLSSILYTLSASQLTSDLAEASRRHDEWEEISFMLFAKVLELGVTWYSGFDSESLMAHAWYL